MQQKVKNIIPFEYPCLRKQFIELRSEIMQLETSLSLNETRIDNTFCELEEIWNKIMKLKRKYDFNIDIKI